MLSRISFVIALVLVWCVHLVGQTTYYSQGTGAWETSSNWNTAPDGSGSTPGTFPNDPTFSIVVQNGHVVTITDGGNYSVNNLTVDGTLLASTATGTPRYINVYGENIIVEGTLGGSSNGMSLDVNGPVCLFSGGGTVQLSRLRKDHTDSGVALVTDLNIDINIDLFWSTTTALYYNGIGNTAKSFNVTINAGKTVTTAGDVSIDGIDGTNNSWADGVFTVSGTLVVGRDLWVTTDNPTGGDIAYIVGSTGKILVGRRIVGNSGPPPTGPAIARLTLDTGGVLEVAGSVSGVVFADVSPTLNVYTFEDNSTVNYAAPSAQNVEHTFFYSNIIISGGGTKSLQGNTEAYGTLTLSNGLLQCGAHNLTILPGGSISGGSTGSYVRTNGAGVLQHTVGAAPVNFPVGNATYNPAVLTNFGDEDVFSVRVFDQVLTNGISGPAITSGVVGRTWMVEEDVSDGSDLTLQLQWNTGAETVGFSRASCYVSRYTGSGWNGDTPGSASGSNPYTRTRVGITALSPFAIGSNFSLPVELAHFEARQASSQTFLTWSTASETTNAYFAVERSTDGHDFREIGRVMGAGTTRETQQYTFLDEHPAVGTNYYRLRQVDLDGHFAFSPVRAVAFRANTWVRVFPSPVQDVLNLEWASNEEVQEGKWEVWDMAGRLLAKGNNESSSTTIIPVHDLYPGTYLLRIATDRQNSVQTFLKH